MFDSIMMPVDLGLPIPYGETFWAEVLNWGACLPRGRGCKLLRALQHGKFDQQIYQ